MGDPQMSFVVMGSIFTLPTGVMHTIGKCVTVLHKWSGEM